MKFLALQYAKKYRNQTLTHTVLVYFTPYVNTSHKTNDTDVISDSSERVFTTKPQTEKPQTIIFTYYLGYIKQDFLKNTSKETSDQQQIILTLIRVSLASLNQYYNYLI